MDFKLGKLKNSIQTNRGEIKVYDASILCQSSFYKRNLAICPNEFEMSNQIKELLGFDNQQKNILPFIRIYNQTDPDCYVIEMPFVEFSLNDLIYDHPLVYDVDKIGDFALQILEAVRWLHDNRVLHSYINPKFIYVENNSNIKLGGFYFAELLATQDAVSNNRNVPYYYPCASLERNKITQKYDIWCIGLVLHELCYRTSPEPLLANINQQWDETLSLPSQFRKLEELYKLLLKFDYRERLSLHKLFEGDMLYFLQNIRSLLEKMRSNIENAATKRYVGTVKIKGNTYRTEDTLENNNTKCIKIRNSAETIVDVNREIKILMNHPGEHMIKYFDNFKINDQMQAIVTEYALPGSLFDYLNQLKLQNKKLDSAKLRDWISQLLQGLVFMSKNNIVHRNIKSSNVIITVNDNGNYVLKYNDFYLAKLDIAEEPLLISKNIVSFYTAPEIFRHEQNIQERYTEKIDVWSLACVIYEMIMLSCPFSNYGEVIRGVVNPTGTIYDQLLRKMFDVNFEKRPDANNCYQLFSNLRVE